jgi:hypothetical protein
MVDTSSQRFSPAGGVVVGKPSFEAIAKVQNPVVAKSAVSF